MIDIDSDTGHPKLNSILLITALFFHFMQQLDLGIVYDIMFKTLTILSLLTVVIVNIQKFIHNRKSKKNEL